MFLYNSTFNGLEILGILFLFLVGFSVFVGVLYLMVNDNSTKLIITHPTTEPKKKSNVKIDKSDNNIPLFNENGERTNTNKLI